MSEYNIQMNKYNALNAGYDQLYPQPMKHASTHAEDGNDPITPADIGVYSKTETNTLLQNKADSSSVYTKTETDTLLQNKMADDHGYIDNCDDMTFNGPYRGYSATINGPSLIPDWNYGAGFAIMRESAVYQFWMFNRYFAARKGEKVDGVWTYKPWEYFNPPMKLGVEYRTTERYLGKPVYAMAVDFGNLPNKTTKEITVSGVSSPDKVVSVFGYTSDCKTIPTFSYGWSAISTLNDAIALDANAYPVQGLRIHVATQQNRSSATAVVVVKYTKSTD